MFNVFFDLVDVEFNFVWCKIIVFVVVSFKFIIIDGNNWFFKYIQMMVDFNKCFVYIFYIIFVVFFKISNCFKVGC